MFGGQPYRLMRAQLAEVLGLDLVGILLHATVYGDADPPHRALVGGIAPTHEEISILFCQSFPVSYQRAPDLLTSEAYAIHMALRKTLLPRSGYPEGFTGLQQRLVLHILTHQPFNVIPRSEKEGTKPPYVCPGCSNHTHDNNMINRCNVINKRVIFLT
jgi:hypothetical protein